MRAIFFLGLMLLGGVAQARLFNINEENFAGYLMVNAGPSNIRKSPFEGEAGSDVNYSSAYQMNYGGEFGFLYATPAVNFRFGLEILKPGKLKGVNASNAAGSLYSVDNDLSGYAPKIGLEINLKRKEDFRIFVVGSLAAASITSSNNYTLTAAGQAAYPGVDTSVDQKGSATEYYGGIGGEIHVSDQTTFVAEAGYRMLNFTKLTYAKDTATFQGTKSSGSTVQEVNGSNRSINFSGALVSIGLRFYL